MLYTSNLVKVNSIFNSCLKLRSILTSLGYFFIPVMSIVFLKLCHVLKTHLLNMVTWFFKVKKKFEKQFRCNNGWHGPECDECTPMAGCINGGCGDQVKKTFFITF
jgi:hypothetical protein